MSAGEEYVVRFSGPDDRGFWAETYSSEAVALAAASMEREGYAYTVHKLGPAITPPEPREWVVVNPRGGVVGDVSTLSAAKRDMEKLLRTTDEDGEFHLARLVFEPENAA